jgi:hypothetical protein
MDAGNCFENSLTLPEKEQAAREAAAAAFLKALRVQLWTLHHKWLPPLL